MNITLRKTKMAPAPEGEACHQEILANVVLT